MARRRLVFWIAQVQARSHTVNLENNIKINTAIFVDTGRVVTERLAVVLYFGGSIPARS